MKIFNFGIKNFISYVVCKIIISLLQKNNDLTAQKFGYVETDRGFIGCAEIDEDFIGCSEINNLMPSSQAKK